MAENPPITIPEIASRTGKANRTIERHIKKLREANRIYRIGSARAGRWRVVEES